MFWLFSSGVITIIKGVDVLLDIASGYRYTRVFELAVYLGAKAYSVVLFRRLYIRNLLLLEGPSYLVITAFYKVFIGFLFRSSRNLREE